MIIDVSVDGHDEIHRFEVRRRDGGFRIRLLQPDGNGAGPNGEDVIDELHVDWREPEEGVHSLILPNGHAYEVHIDELETDEEMLDVHLLSRIVRARAADARKRRMADAAAGPDGLVRLTAPIPGRVVKVLAPEGTEVQRGDGVVVLEAMKMENELKSPRDGVVASVAVQEGQGVEGGALLATIE